MLDVFGFPTPQSANYQEFYCGGTSTNWVKPRGASMVRMLLIGAGGGGSGGGVATSSGGNGGGSGAITEWIGPAIFIPDVLRVSVGAGGAIGAGSTSTTINPGTAGTATSIVYQQKDETGYTLLIANNGGGGSVASTGGAAGTASSNNYFGASGIFNSISGQNGAAHGAAITASATTFLCGGAGGNTAATALSGYSCTPSYRYPAALGGPNPSGNGKDGYFITQPIMVGCGGGGGANYLSGSPIGGNGGNGGIGCGGGGGGRGTTVGGDGGRGGDGAVFIWSW